MENYSHCPYCGSYLSYGNSNCNSCGKPVAPVSIDVGEVSAAIYAQADSASKMLAALVHTHSLPVVSLLEGWWQSLESTNKKKFVTALLQRVLQLVQGGALDKFLDPVIQEHFTPDVLTDRVRILLDKGDADDAITRRVADQIATQLDGDHGQRRAITEALQDTVRQIALERSKDHREVIEAAVRDRMPEIEDMTKRIVEEIANDTAREVRNRMRRDS